MTPSVTITPSPAAPIDPYIGNVSLLLQGNNTILNNNIFLDSNTNPLTITRNGNVAQGSFSPFASNIVAGSAYFDGTGDNLTVSSNEVFNYGASDFTIEFWIYSLSSTQVVGLMAKRTGETYTNIIISISNAKIGVVVNFNSGGNTWGLNVLGTIPINNSTWYHVALVRNGSSFKTYINGVQDTSDTNAGTISFNTADSLSIGSGFSTGQYFYGYLSNFRIIKGTAVYTTNFNVPTSPLSAITNTSLLLHFTNGGVLDGVKKNNVETLGNAGISTSVVKYGSGSLVFTGGTSYLNVGNQPDLDLLSTDYTVEFWLYKNATATYMTVCGDYSVATTNTWQILFDVNGTKIAWFNGANTTFTLTSTNTISNSAWTHIAFVRSGTTLTVYLNGVPNGSATLSTNYSSTTNLFIGHTPELLAGRYLNGYLDDFRITKGVARYTADFSSNLPQQLPSALPNPLSVNYLVVAGGGGGANPSAAGNATSGNNSIFTNIISIGGGGGGRNTAGSSGGSGGGAASSVSLRAPGTTNQGFSGGTMLASGAGGGGGAGSLGGNAPTNNDGGAGGNGVQNSITGISPIPYYAAGGGGGSFGGAGISGIGGNSIGGNGGNPGTSGQARTGSGGGGGTSAATNNGGGGGGAGGLRSTVTSTGGGAVSLEPTLNINLNIPYIVTIGAGGTTSASGGGGGGIVVIKISNAYLAQFSSGCTVNGQTSSEPFIPANLSTSEAGFNTYSVTGTTTTSETVTFVDAANYVSVDYLIVGAGGSGGGLGGGGAGGFRQFSNQPIAKGTVYPVVVGLGQSGYTIANQVGKSGLPSSFNGFEAAGGGGGGGNGTQNGANGGSGGGGGADNGVAGTVGLGNTPSTSPSQGKNGGLGSSNAGGTIFAGGGGGGAGTNGVNSPSNSAGGNGGTGSTSDYSGSSLTYCAGGGGGAYISAGTGTEGLGTINVSGNGGRNGLNATNGSANRGGGGGGAGLNASGNLQGANGTGGSGIVIIRSTIDITNSADYSGATRSTSGIYFIFTFNGSGSIKFS
jgi:hypothetical protein